MTGFAAETTEEQPVVRHEVAQTRKDAENARELTASGSNVAEDRARMCVTRQLSTRTVMAMSFEKLTKSKACFSQSMLRTPAHTHAAAEEEESGRGARTPHGVQRTYRAKNTKRG